MKLGALTLTIAAAATAALALRAETIEQKGKRLIDESLAALGGQAFLKV